MTSVLEALRVLAGKQPGDAKTAFSVLEQIAMRTPGFSDVDRKDVAQDAIFAVVRKMETGEFNPQSEESATGYLARTARNGALSERRKRTVVTTTADGTKVRRRRLTNLDDLDESAQYGTQADETPERDGRAILAQCGSVLDRLAVVAEDARLARYRPDFRTAFDQVKLILFERLEVAALLAGPANTKTERNKLYQAHSRCWAALRDAAEMMENDGRLPAADAELFRRILRGRPR